METAEELLCRRREHEIITNEKATIIKNLDCNLKFIYYSFNKLIKYNITKRRCVKL